MKNMKCTKNLFLMRMYTTEGNKSMKNYLIAQFNCSRKEVELPLIPYKLLSTTTREIRKMNTSKKRQMSHEVIEIR